MPAEGSDTAAHVFDEHLAAWQAYQHEPWGRIRYAVVAHVIDLHIKAFDQPLRILDVGGGDGKDSLRLARLGHHVTIVDYSEGMLGLARQCADEQGVGARITLLRGGIADINGLGLADFDLVLCHFVIQYLAEPASAVRSVVEAARVGGLVSLAGLGTSSAVLAEAVREGDPAAALALLDSGTSHAVTFDHDVAPLDWATGSEMLEAVGAEIVGRYGSRAVVDLIADEELKRDPDFFQDLLRLELAVCGRSPYRDIARSWQLMARRR